MTRFFLHSPQKHTPLTPQMIDECPAIDIHVHAQGTITPSTAWELGKRGGLVTVSRQSDNTWRFAQGSRSIGAGDPHKLYSNAFCTRGGFEIKFDEQGHPIDLDYNYNFVGGGQDKFTGFDAVMATVQGHRHPPGGIITLEDYRFLLREHLAHCVTERIIYTELLQNIYIAEVLSPALPASEARKVFFLLCADLVKEYKAKGVHLRFQHCPNKTSKSGLPGALAERSLDWPAWLLEARAIAPGVFIALNSAGHEEQEQKDGGPEAMHNAYTLAKDAGFGCEAHAGEGIGVEHMIATLNALPVTRIAHGVQVIESQVAIDQVKSLGVTLIMMPCINVALGTPLHVRETADGFIPCPKRMQDGMRDPSVITKYITDLADHPFFPLLRDHGVKIALATDNPGMGGKPYKAQVRVLAGLDYTFPEGFRPLSAEELALCNQAAIDAAFCEEEVKQELRAALAAWVRKYQLSLTSA